MCPTGKIQNDNLWDSSLSWVGCRVNMHRRLSHCAGDGKDGVTAI